MYGINVLLAEKQYVTLILSLKTRIDFLKNHIVPDYEGITSTDGINWTSKNNDTYWRAELFETESLLEKLIKVRSH